jgi:hypothetical protein
LPQRGIVRYNGNGFHSNRVNGAVHLNGARHVFAGGMSLRRPDTVKPEPRSARRAHAQNGSR